jgi:hypothetical protein
LATRLGFIGPKEEAEEIKQRLRAFLQEELKLELSEAKTLITHAKTETARFLNYEIHTIRDRYASRSTQAKKSEWNHWITGSKRRHQKQMSELQALPPKSATPNGTDQ